MAPLLLILTCLPALWGWAASGPDGGGTDLADRSVEVLTVIDGDTLLVRRGEERVTLRLLSVDTEEKISTWFSGSPSKPATVFGQETALWAADLFASLAEPGQGLTIELRFPDEREEYDAFGRLLCHALLPDGRDYNRLLVELGKSPYYTTYGRSLLDDRGFAAAEHTARQARRGIWDPKTNRPLSSDAPSAQRPYERLRAWWALRADALEQFRSRRGGKDLLAADDPDGLERCLVALGDGAVLRVFGELDHLSEDEDGSLTALFRCADRQRALGLHLPADRRHGPLEARLEESRLEFAQNYVTLLGPVHRDGRAFRIVARCEDDLVLGLAH